MIYPKIQSNLIESQILGGILMFILYVKALLEMNCESRIFGILIDRTFLLKEEFLWLMLLQIL